MPHPGKSCRVDELAPCQSHGNATDVPGKKRHVDGGNSDERVHQPGTKRSNNGKRQQDVRKGHQHIDDAHDDIIRPSPEIACDNPDS